MKLWDYIKDNMLKYPKQTVSEGNFTKTYEELISFAEMFSEKLSSEKCCAIYCHSEVLSAMALLGCIAAGVTTVPLSTRYGDLHCKKILEFISPTCVITDTDEGLGVYHIYDSEYSPTEYDSAFIMCTSGTTGTPKGVILSDDNIISNIKDICKYFAIDNEDRILIARPLYHSAVLTGEFLVSLVKGVKVYFSSGPFNPIKITTLIKENGITTYCSTPTLMTMLIQFLKDENNISLTNIVVSGECMSETIGRNIRKKFPHANIYHVYGLTEASPRVSYMPPQYYDEAPDSVGVPLDSVQLRILDGEMKPKRNGEIGVLWVKGPNVMQGYYQNPKLTEEVLKDGWLYTGDIATIDGRGWLEIKGRNDEMIIRAGMNIYPQEIEAEIIKDPRVEEVIVYGVLDERGIEQIYMDIKGNFRNDEQVLDLCAELLPSYQIPSRINLISEIPKGISGKVKREKKNK